LDIVEKNVAFSQLVTDDRPAAPLEPTGASPLPRPTRRRDDVVSTGVCAALLALVLLATGCGTIAGARLSETAVHPMTDTVSGSPGESPTLASATEIAEERAAAPSDATPEPPPAASDGPSGVLATEGAAPDLPDTAALAASPPMLSQAQSPPKTGSDDDEEDLEPYDPFERFNEVMFRFNYNLDRYMLKPVAKAYNVVVPDPWQVMIANGFDNIKVVPRVVNNLLQAKWKGAGREVARFLINSTAGIGGLFDPARDYWGIDRSREDFGQTLGRWGIKPGPYLILPILPPMTVRDGIGRGVDSLIDPVTWLLPFVWTRFGMTLGEMVNDRSLNLDLYEGFEDVTLDLYSAVRHSYMQRRERQVRD
jgi:phospholipid-binding lipoprotein MlaA